MSFNRICITGTSIPIPIGCSEWTITDKIDLDELTPEILESPVFVRVGRDYHSSAIYETVSMFTALVDLRDIEYIVKICGTDYLKEYVDPRYNGNILHAVVLNPNEEVLRFILNIIDDNVLVELANKTDRLGRIPLELISYSAFQFNSMLQYTKMNESLYNRVMKTCPVAQHVWN